MKFVILCQGLRINKQQLYQLTSSTGDTDIVGMLNSIKNSRTWARAGTWSGHNHTKHHNINHNDDNDQDINDHDDDDNAPLLLRMPAGRVRMPLRTSGDLYKTNFM